MALELQITEFPDVGRLPGSSAMAVQWPTLRRRTVTADGLQAAFSSGAKIVRLENFGDAVWVRLNTVTPNDTTQAAVGDDRSIKLPAGTGYTDFLLDKDAAATNYKLDVRAV